MEPDYTIKLRIGKYFLGLEKTGKWFIAKNGRGFYRIILEWKKYKYLKEKS